jgi:predicted O-linked N-acetylglucosamine transferase (SPINDLY family)
MKAFGLDSAETQQRVRQRLGQLGIDSSRVGLHGPAPDHASHLAQYAQVDMALDSFPYNGTATTCDALWMGVPVITLAGQTHVSRVGLSLLTNIGLPELVTSNPEQYVQTAADLASDAQRIAALRQSMRERMRASPLMDATGFARDVEAAYRQMWRTWCRS